MIRQHVQIVTQPSLEPIDLPQARQWLRQDGDDQDLIIQSLIRAAREECENYTGRATLTTAYRDTLERFPGSVWYADGAPCIPADTYNVTADRLVALREIVLMRSPLLAVSSVKYYDGAGVLQTIDSADYLVVTGLEPAKVFPALGKTWPATQCRPDAVQINYTAGYATRTAMPAVILQAMRLLLANWYENREAVTDRPANELPFAVSALLDRVSIRGSF